MLTTTPLKKHSPSPVGYSGMGASHERSDVRTLKLVETEKCSSVLHNRFSSSDYGTHLSRSDVTETLFVGLSGLIRCESVIWESTPTRQSRF